MKAKRLGRGLDALIPQDTGPSPESGGSLEGIDVKKIHANPFQPRLEFDRDGLEDLKKSILEKGVIQPITVRKSGDGYELIAGERRLRSVQELGIEEIPAYVIEVSSDADMLELALIENIQREDLNPIEMALAFQQLQEEHRLTQEEVAQKVGKDRATVANFIRLLKLPKEVQDRLWKMELAMGHARALMGLPDASQQIKMAEKAVNERWSVRQTEEAVRQMAGASSKNVKAPAMKPPAYVTEIEDKLRGILGTQVKLKPSGKGGRLEIAYFSDADLDRLVELFYQI